MRFTVLFIAALGVSKNICSGIQVKTDCGLIQGVQDNGAFSFRGIPYAEPPEGNLRWKPPVPIKDCWKGVFNAVDFGEWCYQPDFLKMDEYLGSENCLFLNVWTPNFNVKASLPVMVWIHGGFNEYMSGNWPGFSPTEKLAKETGIVYVSLNYRLNAFGFMALDVISEASSTGTSGNYGLMDQIEALKWVKKRISYFGGNPKKVTIFGGTDIYALLASEKAAGLFHRAWVSGGSPVLNRAAADASRDNLVFLKDTGCTTLVCLKARSAENITRAIPWYKHPNWALADLLTLPNNREEIAALPVIDGHVLKGEPRTVWMEFRNDVPVMIGTTAQELDFFPADHNISHWTWSHYAKKVHDKLSTFREHTAKTALRLYPVGQVSPEYQFTTMGTDIRLTCPTEMVATQAAWNFKSPVYRYVVTAWPSKPTAFPGYPFQATYAFHNFDFIAFFDTLRNTKDPLSHGEKMFQNNVRRSVLAFVKDGKPGGCWEPFLKTTALLSHRITYVSSYKTRECQFWLNNGFFKYGWVN